MVMRGPTLSQIIVALETACGLSVRDVIQPADDIMQRLEVLQRPLRAQIFIMARGDFEYKVDIDGLTPRNYVELACFFGAALGHCVVILDETKPDPLSAILFSPDGASMYGYVEDAGPDGAVFHPDQTTS